jgi:hypothetical protein
MDDAQPVQSLAGRQPPYELPTIRPKGGFHMNSIASAKGCYRQLSSGTDRRLGH